MNVVTVTMLDNVLIASDNAEAFARAVQTFLERCKRFRFTLNDIQGVPTTKEGIILWGKKNAEDGVTFLGEVHHNGRVCNTDRLVTKIGLALERLQSALTDNAVKITRRNLAAMIGLALFLAHTLQIPLREHYEVLRLFVRLESLATKWDDNYAITPLVVTTMGQIVGPILDNFPVVPYCPQTPSIDNDDYDIIIIVDASKTGYGAIVQFGGKVFVVKGGWHALQQHSARAEPMAATEILQWVRQRAKGRTAIVTDHLAMALAQRRPGSGDSGFSTAHHLNEFYVNLYATGDECQIFYVPGSENPADEPSRCVRLGQPMTWTECPNLLLPGLGTYHHPHAQPQAHQWWKV